MASIISILILTVLFFLTINSISAGLVEDICAQSKDPPFCEGVFYSDDIFTVPQLAQIALDETYGQARPTVKKIEILLPQTKDAQLKKVYSLCKNYFSDALSSLSAANATLKSHDYPSVKTGVDAFSRDVASCKKTFSSAPSKRIEIVDYVASVEHFLDVLAVVVAKL